MMASSVQTAREFETAICARRGHVIREQDVSVSPRTIGVCQYCSTRLNWVEPREGYWQTPDGQRVFTTQGMKVRNV